MDLFFKDDEAYQLYGSDPALSPELFQRLYGAVPSHVKIFRVDNLKAVNLNRASASAST